MIARLVEPSVAPLPDQAAAPVVPPQEPQVQEPQTPAPGNSLPAPPREAAPAIASVPAPAPEPMQVQTPVPQPATAARPGSPAGAEGDPFADYLPRSKLSAPPEPLTSIDVPFPPDVAGYVDLKVRIMVYIDETGRVRRVVMEDPKVPAPFTNAVYGTFFAARFKPAEFQNVPARSVMRLEVAFVAQKPR